jgi:hypothetical protein
MTALTQLIESLRWNTDMDAAPNKTILLRYNKGKSFKVSFRYADGSWANINRSSKPCGWIAIPTDTAADVMQLLVNVIKKTIGFSKEDCAINESVLYASLQEAERMLGDKS